MSILTVISIALGLAMDCFAVSVSIGASDRRIGAKAIIKVASFFGSFQTGMTMLGWALGTAFARYIIPIDHWIAFGLLLIVGSKMLFEAFEKKEGEEKADYSSTRALLILSVATSIDAFAVGVSFSLLNVFILTPAIIIGAASFILPVIGGYAGKKTGELLENKAEILGGLILIGIGVKILLEHILK